MKYILSMFLLLCSLNRIVLSLKINQFHSFCHGYSFLLKISFFSIIQMILQEAIVKLAQMMLKKYTMSLQKAVTKHTFKNLISLRIRSLLSLSADISFSRFRQFLKPLAVLSRRYCYIGAPRKKWYLQQPKGGGKSDLRTRIYVSKVHILISLSKQA